jgi:hypothetical protein
MTTENQHRRKTDDSLASWFKDKVVAPLIVAFIIGSSAGGWALYKKLDDLGLQMQQQYTVSEGRALELRVSQAEREIAIVRSQMVGWDLVKRLEQQMSILASTNKSNAAAAVAAAVIRSELEARKEVLSDTQNKGNK